MTNVTIFTSSKFYLCTRGMSLLTLYTGWNVLIDVCLALLPVTLFWNFNMSVKKRIALSFLMSGGLL